MTEDEDLLVESVGVYSDAEFVYLEIVIEDTPYLIPMEKDEAVKMGMALIDAGNGVN